MQKLNITENRNLYLTAGVGLAVLFAGLFTLAVRYIIPVYNNEITFVHDFSFYKSAAERFLSNPSNLYLTTDLTEEVAFVYPPPAVFIFLPFTGFSLFPAYLLFIFISFIFLFLAVHFFIRSAEELLKLSFSIKQKIIIYLLATGNAPAYMNFQSSQVGPLLIFLISVFIYLLIRNKNYFSGLILAVSIIIKVYPVLLIFPGLSRQRVKSFFPGFLTAFILIPAVSLLFLPLSVYADFFTYILPGLGKYTETNVYNQSLIASALRITGTADGSWALMEIPQYLKIINYLLFISLVVYCGYKIFKSSILSEQVFFTLIIMCAIPVFSTFGWGHLYIFSIPLLIAIIFKHKDSFWVIPLFLVFAADIPDFLFFKAGAGLNSFLYQAFHTRFLFASAGIILYVLINKKTFLR